jgi:hypothetical protein
MRHYEQLFNNFKQLENNIKDINHIKDFENSAKQIEQIKQTETQKLWIANYIKSIIFNSNEYVKRYHAGYKVNLIAMHDLLVYQQNKFKELSK